MLIFLLYLLAVIAPIIFWFLFFAWKDRSEPESRSQYVPIFFVGTLVALTASVVEVIIFASLFPKAYQDLLGQKLTGDDPVAGIGLLILFGGAVVEEILKYLYLAHFAYRRFEFNQIRDGIFYAVTAALGFTLVENTYYFFQIYSESSQKMAYFIFIVAVRAILTTLMHITAAGFSGYALGKKKFTPDHNNFIVIKYLSLAILFHGLFNVLLNFPVGILIDLFMVPSGFLFLMSLFNKPDSKWIWRIVSLPVPPNNTITPGK